MIYLKSSVAGLAAVVVVAGLIIGAAYLAPFFMERLPHLDGGTDVTFFGPLSSWVLVGGVSLVFAAGFYLTFRRVSRGRGTRRRGRIC